MGAEEIYSVREKRERANGATPPPTRSNSQVMSGPLGNKITEEAVEAALLQAADKHRFSDAGSSDAEPGWGPPA